MRYLSVCDIRLHPSTVDSDFEKAMVEDVLPGASDAAYPTDGLFIRSLYRRVGNDFPPGYRCVVHSDRTSDREFFGMSRAIYSLGAYAAEPRYRPLGVGLPADEAALETVRDGDAPGLTRVNNTLAAFWTRDDSVVRGRIEYIVAVLGEYMTEPRLRGSTLQKISDARGVIVDSESFHHVGTVSGDPASGTT